MEKKDWKKKLRELSFMKGYYFKLEDNGLVEKKDDQLVFNREELEHFVQQELDKAREEGFNDGVEKTVGIIQKELDELLLEKDDEKFWVGDILRDCGYSVESILPKNMKGYLAKLKDNK